MTKAPKHQPSRELYRLHQTARGELSFHATAGAEYHLSQIRKLVVEGLVPPYDDTADTDEAKQTRGQRRRAYDWHLRSFFWELVGAFDLMIIWANDYFELKIDESEVKWSKFKKASPTKHAKEWAEAEKTLQQAWDSEWYFEVRTYRNFAHRSFLISEAAALKSGGNFIMLPRAREGQAYVPMVPQALEEYLAKMRELGSRLFKG